MQNTKRIIDVYENWSSLNPNKIGELYITNERGTEYFSFAYDDIWLTSKQATYVLDPDLSLYKGRQYPIDKSSFGLFADSSPDRWGRMLMKRRERFLAENEGRKPRKLLESDYLLGVYDETRMGALRFMDRGKGVFLSEDSELAVPPITSLRSLEAASREFEKNENMMDDKWLNQLLRPGSSLGGARPKATVQDIDGSLWIAKFPSKNDEINVGCWEKVVHDLAKLCSLNVPESRIETFSKLGSTFLVKRFDREQKQRIHFSSAMTMLGKSDGASAADGSSYLELVGFIKANSASPKQDLLELWKRIIFNMAVSNTDDHLRNHGFILTNTGWRLSPLYDVNAIPYGNELSLNVSEDDNTLSIHLAIETAKYYGLSNAEANAIAKEILDIVKNNWEKIAEYYGIARTSIVSMRSAFHVSCEGIVK